MGSLIESMYEKIVNYLFMFFIVMIFMVIGVADIFKCKLICPYVVNLLSLSSCIYSFFIIIRMERKLAQKCNSLFYNSKKKKIFGEKNSKIQWEYLWLFLLFIFSMAIASFLIKTVLYNFNISYNGFTFISIAFNCYQLYINHYQK